MIEQAVRLILKRLRAAKIVLEDQTDDEAEVIIRQALSEVFVVVKSPKITSSGGASSSGTLPVYPTLAQPPLDPTRVH